VVKLHKQQQHLQALLKQQFLVHQFVISVAVAAVNVGGFEP
jgi:hypothetical protein